MAAEWRFRKSEINITRDTEIPEIPEKPLQEPNDAAYHSHQVECDERVEALNKELKDIELERRNKFQEMNGNFKGRSGFSKEFKEQIEE
jgi:hypothetical protein